MIDFLRKRWFLVALLSLTAFGLTLGYVSDAKQVEAGVQRVPTRIVTAFVLFVMAFSLNSQQLRESFKSPAPMLWAGLCNCGILPLMGLVLIGIQLTADFRIGLAIAISAPCTLAAASVWTRKAGGNDAVSLLTTLVTNTLCFAITPFWLHMATTKDVGLDSAELMQRLLVVVLVPTLLGQFVRLLKPAAEFATENKPKLGVVAQSCILILVFRSGCMGGVQLQKADIGTQVAGLIVVWLSCIALHVAALGIAYGGGGLFGFTRRDRIATAFAGSQKTLPIGVYLATDPSAFGGIDVVDGLPVPFAVFPMLMFHASQLFIDTIIADRFAKSGAAIQATTTAESVQPEPNSSVEGQS